MNEVDLRYNNRTRWDMFADNSKKISQRRAKCILPMLVERAKEGKTMTFGELAKKFNIAWAMPVRPAIVCITGTLYLLERNKLPEAKFAWTHGKIPRIANMVTRVGGKPSRWVEEHLERTEDFQPLLDRIYDYKHWDTVLEALGLPKRSTE